MYLRIFHLTTSLRQKLIPKAELKWELPYLYSKKKIKSFGQYFKKSKIDSPLYFQKVIQPGGGFIFGKKNSVKVKHPRICPSFGGNMPEAQFWQVPFKAPPYVLL